MNKRAFEWYQYVAPAVLAAADLYVPDRLAQCAILGELHHAVAAGAVPGDEAFPELGQIIAGQVAGRSRDDQITVCDLTGTGVQGSGTATCAENAAATANATTPSA